MAKSNPPTSYKALESLTRELKLLAEKDDWDSVAAVIKGIRLDLLPSARLQDRPVIEATLENIAAISERAAPLRDDIRKMLAAFGVPLQAS